MLLCQMLPAPGVHARTGRVPSGAAGLPRQKRVVTWACMAQNLKTRYGFRVNAPGFVTLPEAREWFADLKRLVGQPDKPFGLMVDIRGQRANPPDAQEVIKEAMTWMKKAGLVRSAVILDSAVAKIQTTRLARNSGIYAWERYLDASKDLDWEKKAVDWIVHGIDPDKLPTSPEKKTGT